MAQGDTDVSICNDALVLLGSEGITSFDDGSTEAGIASALYPNTRDLFLSMYPWSFAQKKVQLQRETAAPEFEWEYQYALPTDMISTLRSVTNTSAVGAASVLEWEIVGNKLMTDQTEIWVDYAYRPDESLWPPHFVQLMKYILAWHFAEPVTDQQSKAAYWQGMAVGTPSEGGRGGFFRQCAAIDGMGTPNNSIAGFDLVDVR